MKSVKMLISSLLLASTIGFSSQSLAEENNAANMAQPTMSQSEMPQSAVSDKLNINTATASEIQKALIGIGAKKAEAIVQYREKHGAFTAPEQLLEVQGIGKATLEKNQDRITF